VQRKLVQSPDAAASLMDQVGNSLFADAKSSPVVRTYWGGHMDVGTPPIVDRREVQRRLGTVDWINEAVMLMLRLRLRLWEDVGWLQVSVPVFGQQRVGHLKIRAYTRHNRWIVDRAWLEDHDLIVELQRRITAEYLTSKEGEDLMQQLERDGKTN